VVYAYWPWGMFSPKYRKKKTDKKAMLIASSAAPGLMGRMFYGTLKQLQMTAKTVGARPVGSLFIGKMSQHEHPALTEKTREQVSSMVRKLIQVR